MEEKYFGTDMEINENMIQHYRLLSLTGGLQC